MSEQYEFARRSEPLKMKVSKLPGAASGEGAGTARREIRVALVGNPNSGKTTLFNAMTGLRHKVANYPGVTVEKKVGSVTHNDARITLLDLPGTYSLSARSEDERIVRDLLLGLVTSEAPIDVVVICIDASQLERNLFLATQVLDLGIPAVVALTMNDEALHLGRGIDPEKLAGQLGCTVVETVAPRLRGIENLKAAIVDGVGREPAILPWSIGEKVLASIEHLAAHLGQHRPLKRYFLRQIAVQLLLDTREDHTLLALPGTRELIHKLRHGLEESGVAWRLSEARGRYQWIRTAARESRLDSQPGFAATRSDKADKLLTHPLWGSLVFATAMAVVFQSIFSWAGPFMDAIDGMMGWIAATVGAWLPAGPLKGLIVDGIIGGVGGVIIFVPQIVLLFMFIALLEDSGYLARAAFLMHRHMRRVGLGGNSFIPMLSGFACAIPAVMATRTISDEKTRLITMLVVPLTSCSARLPVYALMIAAFIPALPLFFGFTLQGAVLWGAYVFSIIAAAFVALVLRRTILKGKPQPFIMEMPPYRWPSLRTVALTMWDRGKIFVVQAGTVILAINIILWFLASFPQSAKVAAEHEALRTTAAAMLSGEALETELAAIDNAEAGAQLRGSAAGWLGRTIEPLIEPLGFDWKIGVGLLASFAAREVFVSTMAIVYNVGDADETSPTLIQAIQQDRNTAGALVYSPLVALNIIIFFILACQCMSTVAIVKRETNSWKWPLFMVGYMTALAYVVSLVFYQLTSRIWPHLA